MKKTLFVLFLFSTVGIFAQQNGGMWLPTELNEQEMRDLGLEIPTSDIFNPNKPSIENAVVQFDGGCTGEIISPKGLLLTNHHCGYGAIQSHSSLQNDLLSNGFWAKNMSEELPNQGMYIEIVTDIKDVTEQVIKSTNGLLDHEAKAIIKKNIEAIEANWGLKNYQRLDIMPMYYGLKYYAFVVETFNDIRLVGAPPQSIGKFGSDTDNWVWPRHTGDFAVFRIYADKNNMPAEYSADNQPYKPKYFLPISLKEIEEGDFTFVFGYPGRTEEYLPSVAVDMILNNINPAKIKMRDATLAILDQKMRQDNATRIKYAAKYAGISNSWKKWQGESLGLRKSKAVEKKQDYERKLATKVPKISETLDQLKKLYKQQEQYLINNAYFSELIRNSETFWLANQYLNFMKKAEKGGVESSYISDLKQRLDNRYKNYDKELDLKVTAKLLEIYSTSNPQELLMDDCSRVFADEKRNLTILKKLAKGSIVLRENNFDNPQALAKLLEKDGILNLYRRISNAYSQQTKPTFDSIQNQINSLQKRFMAQQMEADTDKVFFPDANFTLRVSYGKVAGSLPKDGVRYRHKTTLDGVMEKYVPNDYEFDVPAKLIELYKSKDYGRYADSEGRVPVAFTATNHTTGGNSGSPVMDSKGNLIGLNFDRQWEGTMSDINFDPNFCRNIMVTSNYILFIIDKFAGAGWLLDEMTIVN